MKTYAGWMGLVVCLALMGLFAWQGGESGKQAKALEQNVTLILENPLGPEEIAQMRETEQRQEEQIISFTAWRESKDELIQAQGTGRSSRAKVLRICGFSQLLLPYGRMLHEADSQGCLIDEKTAEELFGSRKVEGLTLEWDGKLWIVRGMFRGPAHLVILQDSQEENGIGFDRITLERKPGLSSKALGESFLVRHDITWKLLRWDYYQGLSWLGELVPGKWSDFSGWAENIEEKKQEFILLLEVEKGALETEACSLRLKSISFVLLAGSCLLLCLRKIFSTLGIELKKRDIILRKAFSHGKGVLK